MVGRTHGSSARKVILGIVVAATSFVGLGTVTALWDNPFFTRMTPAGGWEIGLLAVLSALLGAYVAVRRPACSVKGAGLGGLLGFLGVACPVCNKILLLLFGGDLLLSYFEPIRLYVTVAGIGVVAVILVREWASAREAARAPEPDAAMPEAVAASSDG